MTRAAIPSELKLSNILIQLDSLQVTLRISSRAFCRVVLGLASQAIFQLKVGLWKTVIWIYFLMQSSGKKEYVVKSSLERVQHAIFKLELVLIQVKCTLQRLILHVQVYTSACFYRNFGEKETLFRPRTYFLWVLAWDILRDSEAFDRVLSNFFAEEKTPALNSLASFHELNFCVL